MTVHAQLPDTLHCSKEDGRAPDEYGRPFRLVVPYTSPEPTMAALRRASEWAEYLGGRVFLLAVRQVPFQLPLDHPDFLPEAFLNQLENLTDGLSHAVCIQLVLARDKRDSLRQLIPPDSMVVIAAERRWRKTEEERLARFLSRAGCTVSLLTFRRHGRGLSAPEPPGGAPAPHTERVKASYA